MSKGVLEKGRERKRQRQRYGKKREKDRKIEDKYIFIQKQRNKKRLIYTYASRIAVKKRWRLKETEGYKTTAEEEKISSIKRISKELIKGSKPVGSCNIAEIKTEKMIYENENDHQLKMNGMKKLK